MRLPCLTDLGHHISPPTVGRLLEKLGYCLRVNVKKQEGNSNHPDRNTQFESIQALVEQFSAAHWSIISMDTKKKELIGNFKNAGRVWKEQPEAVNAHDFPQDALGKAVPYGIYDVLRNCGAVYVGSSTDTPEFAGAALAHWWEEEGQRAIQGAKQHPDSWLRVRIWALLHCGKTATTTYHASSIETSIALFSRKRPVPTGVPSAMSRDAKQILILADSGGSKGCRPRMWK